MKQETITTKRHLRCALTQEELIERGQKLTYHMAEVQAAENDLASFKSQSKSRIDAATAEVRKYQQQVAEQAEWRDVECEDRMDFDSKTVTSIRLDTGEIIGTRRMTEDELQGTLPLE